jgi:hypothetical protein
MNETAEHFPVSEQVQWHIVPAGFLSRHFELFQDYGRIAVLRMGFWREGCEFVIAGLPFVIERKSLWRDGFWLKSNGETYCDVTKPFWSRQFDVKAGDQTWSLRPAGWFTRMYHVLENGRVVGTILPAGWFTRKRTATFSSDVPPPIQVLTMFLVLVVATRQQNRSAG